MLEPGKFMSPTRSSVGGQPEIPVQMELVHQYLTAAGFQVEIVEIDHARVGALGREEGLHRLGQGGSGGPG